MFSKLKELHSIYLLIYYLIQQEQHLTLQQNVERKDEQIFHFARTKYISSTKSASYLWSSVAFRRQNCQRRGEKFLGFFNRQRNWVEAFLWWFWQNLKRGEGLGISKYFRSILFHREICNRRKCKIQLLWKCWNQNTYKIQSGASEKRAWIFGKGNRH